jgi:hypothetical protein
MLLAFEDAEAPALDALPRTDEMLDEAPDSKEDALPAAPPPKIVVDPTVAVPVVEPAESVSALKIAEVVIAEDRPD